MCGIAVIWGDSRETAIRELGRKLSHRGPDADGYYISDDPKCALGHRRLSIVDPPGGRQPLYNEDGNMVIIANGEFYNFSKLKNLLREHHYFMTDSDTEIALHLYEDIGTTSAGWLDGMFAFAILDNDGLFVARDPIGIKPLYYCEYDGTMVFASEIKTLMEYCDEIKEFPPGSYYHSEGGFTRYYNFPKEKEVLLTQEMYCRYLRETVEESVSKRLMSDVPVGVLLSGGLDSSIVALAAGKHINDLHTFSVGLEGSPDLKAARQVAEYLDTNHHEYILSAEEIKNDLGKIIYALESYDQYLVRSAIPCFYASRLASEYVKVILTGEGADELYAGYDYYKEIKDAGELSSELKASIESLHNINLQRLDRMTMAHSIEGRVPFLDLKLIEMAQSIPMELKLRPDDRGELVEKWILRKAFDGLLPDEIVWRDKEQFDEGSGTLGILDEVVNDILTEAEARELMKAYPEAGLRSREEAVYFSLVNSYYGNIRPIIDNMGRWGNIIN